MLEDRKKEILKDNYLLKKREDAKNKTVFMAIKNHCFLFGIFFGLIVLLTLYFISDYSKVYHITVRGNVYLKDSDVIKISGLDSESRFLLVIPGLNEKKMTDSKYIEEATVEKKDNKLIEITVKETKQIAYIYENGLSMILLGNGDRVALDSENAYMLSKLPLIEGYTSDQLSEILRGFKLIDYLTINEISEIHRYPFSYDENMLEVIMKDGNYCFVSWTGLKMLEEYYSIVSGIDASKGNACIYLDELTNSGYMSICPWQENRAENH